MSPLIEALRTHVLAGDRLHGDDTPVPVLDPGRGRTREGRLWVYIRDGRPAGDRQTPPAVCYLYNPDRKGAHHHLNQRGCSMLALEQIPIMLQCIRCCGGGWRE